jgi:hypothetical protein
MLESRTFEVRQSLADDTKFSLCCPALMRCWNLQQELLPGTYRVVHLIQATSWDAADAEYRRFRGLPTSEEEEKAYADDKDAEGPGVWGIWHGPGDGSWLLARRKQDPAMEPQNARLVDTITGTWREAQKRFAEEANKHRGVSFEPLVQRAGLEHFVVLDSPEGEACAKALRVLYPKAIIEGASPFKSMGAP